MTRRDMDYILDQVGTASGALEKILDSLEKSLIGKMKGVMTVDCDGEVNFITPDEAQEIIDAIGKDCIIDEIGKSGFAVIYSKDDKMNYNGDSFLFGDYMIMKFSEARDCLVALGLDDMDSLEAEYTAKLVPFKIGDITLQVYQL